MSAGLQLAVGGAAYLAVQYSTECMEYSNYLAYPVFLFVAMFPLGADPPCISHESIDAINMELIFETNRQAVQRSSWSFIFMIVVIKLFGTRKGYIEDNLMKTVALRSRQSPTGLFRASAFGSQSAGPPPLFCRTPL